MSNFVGQQFGNYRLIRLLGRGGFADVYLGEHIYLGSQAAVKVLRTQLTDESLEEFLREARTIVRLEHPHIIRVLECSMEDQVPFLVMNYAPGGTLCQRYPSGTRLPSEELLLYIKQVASALQYAHDRKLIHRDVKPDNMLLGQNNEVLLSDFGLALVPPSTESQVMKEAAGTVPYMAPEQLEGRPCAASDQYALGIVAYEWLSGECPFQGSVSEIVSQHMVTPPPPLSDRCSGLPRSVERVIFTALAKEPEQRFPSVQAFGAALEQAYHHKAKKWYRAMQLSAGDPSPDQLVPSSRRGLRWSTIALRCLMLGALITLFPFMLIPNFSKVIKLSGASPIPVSSAVVSSVSTVTQAKIPASTAMPSPMSTQEQAVQSTPPLTLASTPTTNPVGEPTVDYSVREINNNDSGISYTGSCYYNNGLSSALYDNDVEVCAQQNDTFTYNFTGKSIYLVTAYSQKQAGTISCYVDGNFTQSYNLRSSSSDSADSSGFTYGVELPIGLNLASGQHTASCKKTSASGKYFVVDALIINK
jgi:serine/threonine protein kinase